MRQVVICSPNIKELFPKDGSIKTLTIEGMPVTCALLETPDIPFDPKAKTNDYLVRVKKRAFSCNYRDKAFLISGASKFNSKTDVREKVELQSIGSDFVADVIIKLSFINSQVASRLLTSFRSITKVPLEKRQSMLKHLQRILDSPLLPKDVQEIAQKTFSSRSSL